jgi:hypothetical protein
VHLNSSPRCVMHRIFSCSWSAHCNFQNTRKAYYTQLQIRTQSSPRLWGPLRLCSLQIRHATCYAWKIKESKSIYQQILVLFDPVEFARFTDMVVFRVRTSGPLGPKVPKSHNATISQAVSICWEGRLHGLAAYRWCVHLIECKYISVFLYIHLSIYLYIYVYLST